MEKRKNLVNGGFWDRNPPNPCKIPAMTEQMKAAWYTRTGSAAETLETGTLPKPSPQPGEVLVRIHASGVNPSDAKKRSGARGAMQFEQIVPHSDGAGIIEAIGKGVAPGRLSERVWLWNAQWNRPLGTAAEYIAIPESQAVPLPDNLAFEDGACLGIPAMTAYIALDINHDPALDLLEHLRGQTVLVTGANGAVAHYAIGFAKSAGAKVITTATNPDVADAAKQMGADLLLEHADVDPDRFTKRVAEFTGGKGVGRIVTSELGSILAITPDILAPASTIAAYGSEKTPAPTLPFYPLMFKNASLESIFVYEIADEIRARAIRGIAHHLVKGGIPALIDGIFPLDEIAAAHERVESGSKRGMVLVTP